MRGLGKLGRWAVCGETYSCPRAVYLVKRGPKPAFHKAPYHPVIIASRLHTAKWEAGWTGDGATLWEHNKREGGSGWLLARWRGLDIDYGHVVRGCVLPDGARAGIEHDRTLEPWTLLAKSVWWSDEPMPEWLQQAGCELSSDDFTRAAIAEDYGDCVLPAKKQDRLRIVRARNLDRVREWPEVTR
jgi:hypothetical protein